MTRSTLLGTLVLFTVASLPACTPVRTFPPTDGSVVADPSVPPTPELMRIGIVTGHQRSSSADQPIVFNLPPGILKATWTKLAKELPAGSRPMQPGDLNAVTIQAVRVDGGRAEVDVVVPQGQIQQLLTLHLTGGGLEGWHVDYVQPWSLRTERPTCNSPWAVAAVEDHPSQ